MRRADAHLLKLEAPLTKGGRFPLVIFDFKKSQLARLSQENSYINAPKKLAPWDKKSVPPYMRVNMIYLMCVHGMRMDQIASSIDCKISTVVSILYYYRRDKRIFSLHTKRSKMLMLLQREDSIKCQ